MKPVSNPFSAEIGRLARRDPRLADALCRVPPFPGVTPAAGRASTFGYLGRAIVYQQLAGAAAATIHGRVCRLTPGLAFPRPHEIRSLPDEALRGAGLSAAKLRALRELSAAVLDGSLDLRRLSRRPEQEIFESLTAVWGIGRWSVQMYLIFKLGRLDIMPATDLGIREGLRRLDGLSERPTPAQVLERAEVWQPLRSLASWALWRLCDE